VLMVWSASAIESIRATGNSYDIASKQLMYAVVGLIGLWFAARLSAGQLRSIAWPLLLVTLVLLVLVLVIGTEVYGSKNWISLGGPFRLQPSEFAKIALIIWGAHILTRKWRPVMDWSLLLVPVLPTGMALMLLVIMEGDFGNAMIIGVIMVGIFYAVGAPLRLFAALGAAGAVGMIFVFQQFEYRRDRWLAFLDPNPDPLGIGYQAQQGTYALGTGGPFGVGLGASREKWGNLPAAHTDFILPVIGEELGLVGTIGVLGLLLLLIWSILRLARETPDRFTQLLAAGMATWLIIQVVTNVGAALKMLPITGVTLPLVSYGGSSLIPMLVGIGLLLGRARRLVPESSEPPSVEVAGPRQAASR